MNNKSNIIFESAMMRNADSMQDRAGNYFKWNLNVFPIGKNKRILDLGSGPGMYFRQIMSYEPSFYMAADTSSAYVERLRSIFGRQPGCGAIQLDLTDPRAANSLRGHNFDYILLFDVLEHLEDDKEALKNTYSIMETCGATALFLRVPALQFIYGTNDRAIGHYRRYSAASLIKLLKGCSFQVDLMRYQNFMAIPLWYIIGNVFKRTLAVSSAEGAIFNCMVPVLRFMETIVRPPLGLSLYGMCSISK